MEQQLHPDIESVVLSKQEIADIVSRLGSQVSTDYEGKNPLVIAILRGAFVFMADLVRAITIPCTMDFMAVSSYGSGVTSSGRVRIVKDLDTNIEGRHVIIAEDILDSGLTLSYLKRVLEERNPASIEICAFSVKDVEGKKPMIDAAYVGTHVPDAFVVGYGLDFDEHYRNLPYLGILKPEVYS